LHRAKERNSACISHTNTAKYLVLLPELNHEHCCEAAGSWKCNFGIGVPGSIQSSSAWCLKFLDLKLLWITSTIEGSLFAHWGGSLLHSHFLSFRSSALLVLVYFSLLVSCFLPVFFSLAHFLHYFCFVSCLFLKPSANKITIYFKDRYFYVI